MAVRVYTNTPGLPYSILFKFVDPFAVICSVTGHTLYNIAVKQLMLPFDPFTNLPNKG